MFYEEDEITQILNCAKCKQKFDTPRILPCGRTICTACLDTVREKFQSHTSTFCCPLCDTLHAFLNFPVNESLKILLQKSPVDVWRSEAVERFKSVLNEIDVHKSTLEGILQNGLCQIKDHCLSLRQKVDLAAEQAIEEIQLNREDLMQQIDSYEISTGQTFKNDQLSKDEFERSASECSSFSAQWRAYLKKVRINEEDILNTYDSAVALKTETERKIVQLNTLVFGRKLIDFERGFTTMPGLGQIRHQSLNFCRLDDFECLDISGRVCRAKKIEVLARVDNSFEVFFIDYCNRAVERLTFDKQSSQVVGSDSVRKENYLCLRRIDETAVLTQYTDEYG